MLTKYNKGENVFQWMLDSKFFSPDITLQKILDWYRFHKPKISLRLGALSLIENIKAQQGKIGLLTDGRSISQRNKIDSLGINGYIDRVVISEDIGTEKPNVLNFLAFKDLGKDFIYLGDNLKKDFIAPNQLGWLTICINGENKKIYKNDGIYEGDQNPDFFINDFSDLNII